MQKILFAKLTIGLTILLQINSVAQSGIFECYKSKIESQKFKTGLFKKNTVDTNIDIKYIKLDLFIDPDNNHLSGIATINAQVIAPSINQVSLDLKNNMSVQSINSSGAAVSYNHSNATISIQLEKNYTQSELVSLDIQYSGTPSIDSLYGSPMHIDTYHGHKVAYTHSEYYMASYWFPCKEDLSDKADSVKIWVTANSYYKVASNGLLESETDNGDGTTTTKWATHYPIANYLMCVTMSDYVIYQNEFDYDDSKSMPMMNFVWQEDLAKQKPVADFTVSLISFFSEKFGLYPFINEKYGQTQALGGGMEHQTMTTMYRSAPWSHSVTAHELAHQWFGDAVTFKDYHNIWLSEGFASYCDLLHVEKFEGKQNFNNQLDFYANSPDQLEYAAKNAKGSIYIEDISSYIKIYNPGKTYRKAAWVLHMLRGIVGDETFFSIMKNYANSPELKYKNAVTSDFQKIAEETSGKDLNYFFNEWIYGENYPKYSIQWGSKNLTENNYEVKIILSQEVNTNPNFFTMPVQIKLKSSTGDTTITLFNNSQNQTFIINLNEPPSEVTLDPNNYILKDVLQIVNSVNKSVKPTNYSLAQNYPNPFNPETTIEYKVPKPGFITIKIYNIKGEEVKTLINAEQTAGSYSVNWNGINNKGQQLSSGIYYYRIEAENYSQTRKMILLK